MLQPPIVPVLRAEPSRQEICLSKKQVAILNQANCKENGNYRGYGTAVGELVELGLMIHIRNNRYFTMTDDGWRWIRDYNQSQKDKIK